MRGVNKHLNKSINLTRISRVRFLALLVAAQVMRIVRLISFMANTMMNRKKYWLWHIGWNISIFFIAMLIVPQTYVKADSLDDEVERLKTYARIDWAGASAPLGRILLLRRDKVICAVRFTRFHRGHDAKPPTIFNWGEESRYAEYDFFCQADGSGDFNKQNITKGHRKLVEKPLKGIGRLAFQTGKVAVKCGPFKLFWYYPTFVAFSSSVSCSDSSIELAPTKWKQIEEVAISSSGIKWYHCDEHRESIYIPIDEL